MNWFTLILIRRRIGDIFNFLLFLAGILLRLLHDIIIYHSCSIGAGGRLEPANNLFAEGIRQALSNLHLLALKVTVKT